MTSGRSTDLTVVVRCGDDLADVLSTLESLATDAAEEPHLEVALAFVGDPDGVAGAAAQAVSGVASTVVAATGRGRGADFAAGLVGTPPGTAALLLAAGERVAPGAVATAVRGVLPGDVTPVQVPAASPAPREPLWTAAGPLPRTRRNLVFLRAGRHSLHWGWAVDPERSFDLVIDAWAGNAEEYVGSCDVLYDGLAETWTLAIHRFFADRPGLLDHYDAVWVTNDDIETTPETIEAMFALHAKLGYALAQPALTPDSHVVHSIVTQHEGLAVRETSFVETMVPLWRSDALRHCLSTYADFPRGHGQDSVWPALLADVGGRCAVYDLTPVRHTRPAGSLGVQGGTLDEALRLAIDTVSRYGLPAGILPKVVHRAWDTGFVELPRTRLYHRLAAAYPQHVRSPVLDWDVYAAALQMTREHAASGILDLTR